MMGSTEKELVAIRKLLVAQNLMISALVTSMCRASTDRQVAYDAIKTTCEIDKRADDSKN